MNQYRTDLAIECQEILDESAGIQMEKIEYNGGIRVTRIKIISQEAAKKMGKPVGSYITLEADGVLEEEDGIKEKTAKAVAGELGQPACGLYIESPCGRTWKQPCDTGSSGA